MIDIREIPGKGMQGYIGSKLIKLGNSKFCNTKYLKDSKKIHLFLNINDEEIFTFQFEDQLRPDANKVVTMLKEFKFNIFLHIKLDFIK